MLSILQPKKQYLLVDLASIGEEDLQKTLNACVGGEHRRGVVRHTRDIVDVVLGSRRERLDEIEHACESAAPLYQ